MTNDTKIRNRLPQALYFKSSATSFTSWDGILYTFQSFKWSSEWNVQMKEENENYLQTLRLNGYFILVFSFVIHFLHMITQWLMHRESVSSVRQFFFPFYFSAIQMLI